MTQGHVSNAKLLEIISVQTDIVQQGVDLGNIMTLVTQKSQQITQSDGASIELIEGKELVYSAVSGMAEKYLGLRLAIENSLSGECIRMRIPLLCNDIEQDDRVNKEACRQIGLNAMIVVPLICMDSVVGVMKVMSKTPEFFSEEDEQVLNLMSGLIAAAMANAMKNEDSELLHQATHDSMTGIANRGLFYDRLRQKLASALVTHESFGLISVDMDGLKGINDNLGHRAGDAAIKALAQRMESTLRKTDLVARLGGDEFGLIVSHIVDSEEIRTFIQRLDVAITAPFIFEETEIPLRASIGYALFSDDGIELETLIEKADQSMYATKKIRKGAGNVR